MQSDKWRETKQSCVHFFVILKWLHKWATTQIWTFEPWRFECHTVVSDHRHNLFGFWSLVWCGSKQRRLKSEFQIKWNGNRKMMSQFANLFPKCRKKIILRQPPNTCQFWMFWRGRCSSPGAGWAPPAAWGWAGAACAGSTPTSSPSGSGSPALDWGGIDNLIYLIST